MTETTARRVGTNQREQDIFNEAFLTGWNTHPHSIQVAVNQYGYFPYGGPGSPKPPAPTIDDAAMWGKCPDTKDCTPNDARLITMGFEEGARARFRAFYTETI